MQLTINTKYQKTYKTLANLNRALEKINIGNHITAKDLRHLIVWTECGRVTAVFIPTKDEINAAICAMHKGFKLIG